MAAHHRSSTNRNTTNTDTNACADSAHRHRLRQPFAHALQLGAILCQCNQSGTCQREFRPACQRTQRRTHTRLIQGAAHHELSAHYFDWTSCSATTKPVPLCQYDDCSIEPVVLDNQRFSGAARWHACRRMPASGWNLRVRSAIKKARAYRPRLLMLVLWKREGKERRRVVGAIG